MESILVIAGTYLACGVVAVAVLDLTTKRVRRRIKWASATTQSLIGGGSKAAVVVTAIALWLFWPWAIYAAIRG